MQSFENDSFINKTEKQGGKKLMEKRVKKDEIRFKQAENQSC